MWVVREFLGLLDKNQLELTGLYKLLKMFAETANIEEILTALNVVKPLKRVQHLLPTTDEDRNAFCDIVEQIDAFGGFESFNETFVKKVPRMHWRRLFIVGTEILKAANVADADLLKVSSGSNAADAGVADENSSTTNTTSKRIEAPTETSLSLLNPALNNYDLNAKPSHARQLIEASSRKHFGFFMKHVL
jgi:hypothetical protein